MQDSQSVNIPVRGLNYHCRVWGSSGKPTLFLLHGFQDGSASWQFTVDALKRDWYVVAPDWRGYGLSDPSRDGSYWFPDLVGDLDAVLDHFEPEYPARLVGHSMGASVASTYAGAIPARIEKLVNIEGLGGPLARPEEVPRRYSRWLAQLSRGARQRPYMDFAEFAERMMSENPRLTPERAQFLVQHWGREEADGTVWRRADPAHTQVKPLIWRLDESLACWGEITAPVLFVEGAESRSNNALKGEPDGYETRLGAFKTLDGVVSVSAAGHNIHHDQPQKLADIIEGFM